MGKISMKGVCDMHVHTNPDLRLRAYDDFELAKGSGRIDVEIARYALEEIGRAHV